MEQKNENKLSELHKKILDNAPISIVTIDKDGNMTSANKYYKQFSKTGKMKNRNIFKSEFFIRERLVGDYKRLLQEGIAVKTERCFERNSRGEDKYMKIVAVPLKDKRGNIEGALSMAVDNTEAVLFEKKLQEFNNNLELKIEKKTADLNDANKKIAQALKMKSILMADVSHELRTSLAIIQGNLELILSNSVSEAESSESKNQIESEIGRMSTMLKDLTTLESDPSKRSDRQRIHLDKLISTVCKSLKVVADQNGTKIIHDAAKSDIEITADRNKLEELVSNLLRNAIKYNKKNGRVKIWLEKNQKNVNIKVKDNGIGIRKEHIPHIFERFYRVDKDRSRKSGGSGLGLAICNWITRLHGGKITVESDFGQGSLFTVSLPIAKTEPINSKN